MNYAGKFDAKLSADGSGLHGHVHVETVPAAHVPSDAIVVPDAQLLFNGDFRRSGVDLILSRDHQELVLHDYFKGEKRAALSSPDGAHLTGDVVNALAGNVQYAQADGSTAAGHIIGHVTKLVGTATAVRNGVSVILNNGDNVEKGDVVQSGSDSTLGITFIDGTVFGLSSNARMVLNEMVYDPNGSNNSSLLSLVAGTITFVAGETAKHGDMKVDTPVATMGIRGTAVLVEIDFDVRGQNGVPDAKFQVLVEPDGTTGSYILFDKTTLTPLAVVDTAGQQINISNGILSQTTNPLSPEIQKLIIDVFTLKFSDNSNPQTNTHFSDTPIPQMLAPIKLASGVTATPFIVNQNNSAFDSSSPSGSTPPPSIPHIEQAPNVVASGNSFTVRTGTALSSGVDTVSGGIHFTDINAGDLPTVTTHFVSLKLLDAQHNDITATLTSQQIAAVEAQLVVTPSPGNNNNGTATWTYSAADGAFNFLTAGETLTLTYDAVVNNNFLPFEQVAEAPFAITINGPNVVEWIHPTGDLWSVGSNWNSGAVPAATDDVIIPAEHIPGGSGLYDVTIETQAFARTLTLNANNTTGGQVINHSTLTIGETLTIFNDGVLNDSGTVSVGSQMELLNQSSLLNSGLITLGQGGDFKDQSSVSNSGTIEVKGGTLNIDVAVANSGGTLQIDSGATLDLGNAIINGGTLGGNGTIVTAIGNIDSTLNGVSIANNTLVTAVVGTLELTGTIANNGEIDATTGTLELENATINGGILGGPGTIATATGNIGSTLSGVTILSGVKVTASVGTLDVSGIITNNGEIDAIAGTLNLENATVNGGTINVSGVMDSTGISFITGATIVNDNNIVVVSGTLTIDPTAVTNTGTIEVAGDSTLVLIGETITNSDGTTDGIIQVDATTGTLDLEGSTINGGTLTISGLLDSTGTSFINDATITNAPGATLESTGGVLTIDGGTTSFVNAGTVEANGAELDLVNATVANTGGTVEATGANGVLNLKGAGIDGGTVSTTASTDVIEATSGISTISGTSSFVNAGTVEANGAELDLVNTTVSNTGGTVEATGANGVLNLKGATVNGGTLGGTGTIATATGNTDSTLNGVTIAAATLVTAAVGTLDLTGTITNKGEIDATTGTLDLENATVNGGTLGGTGTIAIVSGADTLNGVAIASGTTVKVTDNTALELKGTIANGGAIALNSSGDNTQLEISGDVSLNGSGQVTLTDKTDNFIVSDGSAATLTNSNTITGAGTIGDTHLTLVNNGTIDATGTHPLTIDTGTNAGLVGSLTVTNNAGGILEASAGHTLQIDDNVLNSGSIEAGNAAVVNVTGNITGTGSIELFNNAKIEIGGSVSSGQTVTFSAAGAAATLILDDSHDFHGTIVGLVEASVESQENHVDLKDLTYVSGHMSAHFNSSADTVTVSNGTSSVTLNLSGGPFDPGFELAKDATGGTLIDDPSVSSGLVTIDSGKTLDISAASTATVTFTNSTGSTGELVLDNSKAFAGQIVGFAGDGTISNSDLIDLGDVNFADVATNKTTYTDNGNGTGTLTLHDANGQALDSITFAGSYQLANFTIENDGSGNTLIVDPPVSTSPAVSGVVMHDPGTAASRTIVASAPNQTLSGLAASDTFVFNFAAVGQDRVTNFHPATDTLQLSGTIFANAQAALNAAQDDGHGNTVVALDAHDTITLSGVLKAQLHVSDFHVV